MHFASSLSERQNFPLETAQELCDLVSLKPCTEWCQRLHWGDGVVLSIERLVWFCGWEQGGLSRWGQQHEQNCRSEKQTCDGDSIKIAYFKEVEFEQKRVPGGISRVEPNCGGFGAPQQESVHGEALFVQVQGLTWYTYVFRLICTPRICIVQQPISNYSVHKNDLGILLKCRFWLSRSWVGPEILHF